MNDTNETVWLARGKPIISQSWPNIIRVLFFSRFFRWEKMKKIINKTRTERGGPSSGQEYLRLKDGSAVHWICRRSSFSLLPLALDFLGKQKVWIRREVQRTSKTELHCLSFGFPLTNEKRGHISLVSLQPEQRQAHCWEQRRGTIYSHLSESKTMLSHRVALCDPELNSRLHL